MNYNAYEKSFAKNAVLISDLLDQAAEALPEKTLFKDSSGQTVSYGQAKQLVDSLASGLTLEGFQTNDRIGLIGKQNSSDWCICYLAILKIGAVVVPLDPGLKVGELLVLLKDCKASGIITDSSATHMFERLKPNIKSLLKIFVLSRDNNSVILTLRDLIIKGQNHTIKPTNVHPDSLAVLIYTSGTTGRPKGVMLSHTNIISDLRAIHKRLFFNCDDVVLSILPLHHAFECTCGFLNSISLGLKIIFAKGYKSNELLEDIRMNRVSFMCGVPLLYEKMYLSFKRKIDNGPLIKKWIFKVLYSVSQVGGNINRNWGKWLFSPLRKKAGIDSLRMLVSGGAALQKNVSEFFNTIGIPLFQGYGLSETSPVLSVNSPHLNKWASVGKPLDGIDVSIESNNEDKEGEIIVKGPMIMLGYYKNEDETSNVLNNGWFRTGDIGFLDRDNFLYITGRSKNVIVSAAGKNIHPEELEALLCESPYILEALVFGIKISNSNVEEITAVIVPDTEIINNYLNSKSSPEEQSLSKIIQAEVGLVCSRLADFKRIKKHYICYEGLPKTTSKKLKRCLEIDKDGILFEKKVIGIEANN
jgi:long-chain acyl-CoA synthetase